MPITVKKLIAELEKIENQYLEVECAMEHNFFLSYEISKVVKGNKKVLIYTKDLKDD